MAGRLLAKLKSRDPAALARDCHQAFMRLPFEANPERVAEEIAKLLHLMKVGVGDRGAGAAASSAGPGAAVYLAPLSACQLGRHAVAGACCSTENFLFLLKLRAAGAGPAGVLASRHLL